MFTLLLIQWVAGCSDHEGTQGSERFDAEYAEKAEQVLTEHQQSSAFMGNIVVLKNGQQIFQYSSGFSQIEENLRNSESTGFRIGSVSKIYTAAAIFKAIEQGRLSLDDILGEYFPMIESAERITIAHLLQHQSGIANYTSEPSFRNYHVEGITKEELLNVISSMPREFDADSQTQYSNSNYFLLANILETVYQLPYAEIINNEIVQPLQFSNTYHPLSKTLSEKEAASYDYTGTWELLPTTSPSSSFGAGSLVSTADEVGFFLHQLMIGNVVNESSLISMKDIERGFGMGLQQISAGAYNGFGHGGKVDGFESIAVHFPQGNLTIAIISNGTSQNLNPLMVNLAKATSEKRNNRLRKSKQSFLQGVTLKPQILQKPLPL
ncbi:MULTISPECIES: serine hydrolase [Gammaproteobacteria]|uniref:serine hydrolase domain-containing protein n=1 Tax=Gammaproteobacteria TaxID=1236 RepID=UPI0014041A62|nr:MULTISPECIES: serine hydrolase domain-containing protein [Gammaproteobacteria]